MRFALMRVTRLGTNKNQLDFLRRASRTYKAPWDMALGRIPAHFAALVREPGTWCIGGCQQFDQRLIEFHALEAQRLR